MKIEQITQTFTTIAPSTMSKTIPKFVVCLRHSFVFVRSSMLSSFSIKKKDVSPSQGLVRYYINHKCGKT